MKTVSDIKRLCNADLKELRTYVNDEITCRERLANLTSALAVKERLRQEMVVDLATISKDIEKIKEEIRRVQ